MAPITTSRREGVKVPLGGQVFNVILALTAVAVLTLFLSEITAWYSTWPTCEANCGEQTPAQRVLAIKFWRRLPPVVWCKLSWFCLIWERKGANYSLKWYLPYISTRTRSLSPLRFCSTHLGSTQASIFVKRKLYCAWHATLPPRWYMCSESHQFSSLLLIWSSWQIVSA